MPTMIPPYPRANANRSEKAIFTALEGIKVGWRSIFKFKGLEAGAVIITDLNPAAVETTRQRELDLDDLLYVGMTRAKYQCIVLDSAQYLR